MTRPADPALQRPKAREIRTPARRRVSTTPQKGLTGGGGPNGEGGEKSEPAVAETGAGATFSESRKKGGGSEGVQRGHRRALKASAASAGQPSPENPEGAPDASEGQTAESEVTPADPRRVIGGSTFAPVAAEGDPGPGFYRFRKADIPGLGGQARDRMGNVIELYAQDLAGAQHHLGLLVANEKRQNPPLPVEIRPTHHRRTRVSKKHRKVIG